MDTLFEERNIKTSFVDQLDLKSLVSLKNIFRSKSFDLIIDDGLHSSEANLNTLIFSLDALSAEGYLWIEDIPIKTLSIWLLVRHLVDSVKYECDIYQVNSDSLGFLMRRLSSKKKVH